MSNGYQSPVNQPGITIGGRERGQSERLTESWAESALFTEESREASGARAVEDERKLWWSVGLGLLGSLFGPIGTIVGAGVGKIVGELGTVEGKQAEEYLVSTDVGKYDKQKKLQLEDFNKTLTDYDRGQLWTDIMDIGKVALGTYKFSARNLKDFDLFSWGGKEGDPALGTEFLGDAWERLFPNKD
tara:strand:+ start:239 stop:799 length:561 start_codon:yes stop_codon:yes gene_type:complete